MHVTTSPARPPRTATRASGVPARRSSDRPQRPAPPLAHDVAFHVPAVEVADRVHDDEHLALWQVRGSAVVDCSGTRVEIGTHQVAWVPAGFRHALQVRQNSVLMPMFFDVATTATVLDEITVVPVAQDERLFLLALHQSQSTVIRPAANLERQVLAILERRALATDAPPHPVNPAAAAVARALAFNPGDDRRIADWAREVRVSGRSLERAFAAETGLSFGQWRARCRMDAAVRLLRAGSSVTSVARRVGYEDPSSFSRAFRAYYGRSPGSYTEPEPAPAPAPASAEPVRP